MANSFRRSSVYFRYVRRKMKEEEPDIIVIAGDLYDTTYPSKDAIMLLEQAIES